MEGSYHVLAGNEIDGCLTPDGSIDLRQYRRGNLHKLDTAHIEGRQ